MTLTGALILESEKILFADTLWKKESYFFNTKIFSNERNDYLITSGFVSKNLIKYFSNNNYDSIVSLLADSYKGLSIFTSCIYYNNHNDDINAYFIEGNQLSKLNVESFILIGYQAGENESEKINSINQLYEILRNYSKKYPEIIGNKFEFKVISNKKLIDSYDICF